VPVKYWQVKAGFYGQAQFYFQSLFDVILMYYNNLELELKKFNIAIWVVNTFTSKFAWCPGLGWNVQSIDLNLTIRQSFQQCYKTLILDFCNFFLPWTGEKASFFEKCERS
jgi:hypothetical protein